MVAVFTICDTAPNRHDKDWTMNKKHSKIDSLLGKLTSKVEQAPAGTASGLVGRELSPEELHIAAGGLRAARDTCSNCIVDDCGI